MAFRGKNVTIARHDKSTWCECSWVLMDEIWKMCRIWTVAAVFSERRIFFFLHTAGSHSSLGGPKTKAECSTLRQGMAQRRVSKNIVGAGQNDAVGRQTLSNHCTRTPETILLLTVRGMFFKAFEYGHWPPRLNVDCHQFFCAKKKKRGDLSQSCSQCPKKNHFYTHVVSTVPLGAFPPFSQILRRLMLCCQ